MPWGSTGWLLSASTRDDVIKGVAGSFLTLIGVLFTLSTTWFKERGKYPRRIRSLDEATKIVAFWEGWYKALKTVQGETIDAACKDRALEQILASTVLLEQGRRKVRVKTAWEEAHGRRLARLPRWRRVLFFYKHVSPWAWVFRAQYWFILTIYIPATSFSLFSLATATDTGRLSVKSTLHLFSAENIMFAAFAAMIWVIIYYLERLNFPMSGERPTPDDLSAGERAVPMET